MRLTYISPDGGRSTQTVQNTRMMSESRRWGTLQGASKQQQIMIFFNALKNGVCTVLYDNNHKALAERIAEMDICPLPEGSAKPSYISKEAALLFFTSGSTGFPVGALKSRGNIERELQALASLIEPYAISRVVATVPYVHIYGILAGVLLPNYIGAELVVKEEFLPDELLHEASQPGTLIVTTPVFIRALNRLKRPEKMPHTLFLSSTGPLAPEEADTFHSHYQSDLLQLFGSTETGGIAYKYNGSSLWSPLPDVEISQSAEYLAVTSPYVSSYLLKAQIEPQHLPFQTEDIITAQPDGSFELIGRSGRIAKIAGKRISTAQIEQIIEKLDNVDKAIVTIKNNEGLRDEKLEIVFQANAPVTHQEITKLLVSAFGTLNFSFSLKQLDEISISSMGKKLYI